MKADSEGGGENPYLTARREWNERYGGYIQRARQWQVVALLSLVIAVISVVGVAWMGSRSRFVPYVIEVDKLGAAVPVHRADEARAVDDRVVRAQLARWISCVRSVVADVAAERELLEAAYATIAGQSAAYSTLNEMFARDSPLKRAEIETVSVEVQSVLLLAGSTWRVEWVEIVRARADGKVMKREPWQATVTVAINAPSDEATILRNPMGIYVTSYAWQKRL